MVMVILGHFALIADFDQVSSFDSDYGQGIINSAPGQVVARRTAQTCRMRSHATAELGA